MEENKEILKEKMQAVLQAENALKETAKSLSTSVEHTLKIGAYSSNLNIFADLLLNTNSLLLKQRTVVYILL